MFKYILNNFGFSLQIVNLSFIHNTVLNLFRTLRCIYNCLRHNTLINIFSSIIKYPQHRNDSIRRAIRAANMAPRRAHIVYMQTDSPRIFGNHRAFLQSIEYPVDTVALHCQQETRRELGFRRARVKQSRRGVSKILLGH